MPPRKNIDPPNPEENEFIKISLRAFRVPSAPQDGGEIRCT